MLSRTGVLVVGVTSVARGSKGESERESPVVNVFVSSRAPAPASTSPLRKALDIPFIDARRCPVVQRGVAMRYVAGGKYLEPCTRANVAVGEVP
jgi:hypothetical protein